MRFILAASDAPLNRIYEAEAYGSLPHENSYWRTTTDAPAYAALTTDQTCDIAIIGAGYTGLHAARRLAGEDVVVLDSGQPGWGASGRNGGFCCLGGAHAGYSELVKKFGAADAQAWAQTQRASVDHVDQFLQDQTLDVDRHSDGETILAHTATAMENLRHEQAAIREIYGLDAPLYDADHLGDQGLNATVNTKHPRFAGALTIPVGFALNPLKYATGLADAVVKSGAALHGDTPVLSAEFKDGNHILRTPQATLRARKVIFATNGYSSENLPTQLKSRYLPVQSNILVTRPLTQDELAEQGWTSRQMCYDTRNLLHYFRLLPDNRMLFGMRGATSASPQAFAEAETATRQHFETMFPAWAHIGTPYFWSGLISGARNFVPFAGALPDLPNAYAAMCYHGNGVAMGSYCGTLVAEKLLGQAHETTAPDFLEQPLAAFPFGRYRRHILPLLYRWYSFQDGA